MKSKGENIKLTSIDDLFSSEQSRSVVDSERVQKVSLSELHHFPNHPFKVKDDDAMAKTIESIKQYGVLVPGIARPLVEGGYEIVAGHRRHHASGLAGCTEMPFLIRNLNDDEATIIMVDSNLQRENILPSERAYAYKMKLEAIKRQGARTDLTSVQIEQKLNARDVVAKDAGESAAQVQRYIRLTELNPILLEMVDDKKIGFSPAVELSYLKPEEQIQLLDAMESEQATPSISQAQRLKKFSQEGSLSPDVMRAIMSEEKKSELEKITISTDTLKKYFPQSYTPQKMEQTIISLLTQWQKKRQQSMER